MTAAPREIELILDKKPDQTFALWACVGRELGCPVPSWKKKRGPCAKCYGPLPDTLQVGEIWAVLEADRKAASGGTSN